MDRILLLKSYHIPEEEDGNCLLELPNGGRFRELSDYVYTLGCIQKDDLHQSHILHKSFVDPKSLLHEQWDKSRRIGETMLCDSRLPSQISDYNKYYHDRMEDHYSLNNKQKNDESTKKIDGKRSHVYAFDSYDESNLRFNKFRPTEIDLIHEPNVSDDELDVQRALYTSTREKREKGK